VLKPLKDCKNKHKKIPDKIIVRDFKGNILN